jgi:hypothetical protein
MLLAEEAERRRLAKEEHNREALHRDMEEVFATTRGLQLKVSEAEAEMQSLRVARAEAAKRADEALARAAVLSAVLEAEQLRGGEGAGSGKAAHVEAAERARSAEGAIAALAKELAAARSGGAALEAECGRARAAAERAKEDAAAAKKRAERAEGGADAKAAEELADLKARTAAQAKLSSGYEAEAKRLRGTAAALEGALAQLKAEAAALAKMRMDKKEAHAHAREKAIQEELLRLQRQLDAEMMATSAASYAAEKARKAAEAAMAAAQIADKAVEELKQQKTSFIKLW